MVAALVTVGCGHHSHHRDHESLTGKVIKYPFRMTGYAIGAPFHPFKSARKAFDATVDIPLGMYASSGASVDITDAGLGVGAFRLLGYLEDA